MTNEKYVVTSNVQSGHTYHFRYRAKNAFGWGEWSDSGFILTALIPDTSQPMTITQ